MTTYTCKGFRNSWSSIILELLELDFWPMNGNQSLQDVEYFLLEVPVPPALCYSVYVFLNDVSLFTPVACASKCLLHVSEFDNAYIANYFIQFLLDCVV